MPAALSAVFWRSSSIAASRFRNNLSTACVVIKTLFFFSVAIGMMKKARVAAEGVIWE